VPSSSSPAGRATVWMANQSLGADPGSGWTRTFATMAFDSVAEPLLHSRFSPTGAKVWSRGGRFGLREPSSEVWQAGKRYRKADGIRQRGES